MSSVKAPPVRQLVLVHGPEIYILRYVADEGGLEFALASMRQWYDSPGANFDEIDCRVGLMVLEKRHGDMAMARAVRDGAR